MLFDRAAVLVEEAGELVLDGFEGVRDWSDAGPRKSLVRPRRGAEVEPEASSLMLLSIGPSFRCFEVAFALPLLLTARLRFSSFFAPIRSALAADRAS